MENKLKGQAYTVSPLLGSAFVFTVWCQSATLRSIQVQWSYTSRSFVSDDQNKIVASGVKMSRELVCQYTERPNSPGTPIVNGLRYQYYTFTKLIIIFVMCFMSDEHFSLHFFKGLMGDKPLFSIATTTLWHMIGNLYLKEI